MKEQMTVEMLRYQIASNGKWRHVPRVNSLITKKIGSCGCLILEESTSRDK